MDLYEKLVKTNPGNGSVNEYRYLGALIEKYAPGNLLVFSVGKDSNLWMTLNKNGNTVFCEDVRKWIRFSRKITPEINVVKVNYRTRRKQWEELLGQDHKLQMRLPDFVKNTVWDAVFVDGPRGYNDKVPGRMQSIFSAAQLKTRNLLVHDCDREVEKTYFTEYIGKPTHVVEKLYHKEFVL